jgi:hypothetical protein
MFSQDCGRRRFVKRLLIERRAAALDQAALTARAHPFFRSQPSELPEGDIRLTSPSGTAPNTETS